MANSSFCKRVFSSFYYLSVKQYWWNLMVNGFLMSYFVPVGLRRLILNIFGHYCPVKAGKSVFEIVET